MRPADERRWREIGNELLAELRRLNVVLLELQEQIRAVCNQQEAHQQRQNDYFGTSVLVRQRYCCPNLGHEVARGTIANILKEHGLEPAPERERKTTWKEFLSQHREVMVAADFFTIEAWTRKGLTRFLVLFLIALESAGRDRRSDAGSERAWDEPGRTQPE